MNFSDIWNKSQEDYYILFNKRVLSDSWYLFDQHGVKILITSFWDTQYTTKGAQKMQPKKRIGPPVTNTSEKMFHTKI